MLVTSRQVDDGRFRIKRVAGREIAIVIDVSLGLELHEETVRGFLFRRAIVHGSLGTHTLSLESVQPWVAWKGDAAKLTSSAMKTFPLVFCSAHPSARRRKVQGEIRPDAGSPSSSEIP